MGKWANDLLMDAGLGWLQSTAIRVAIGTAAGTTYAEATAAAVGTLATSSGNFTIANGDASGRKITHAAATIVVGTTGTVNHIFLYGTAGSGTLCFAGTCPAMAVTATGTAILAAWDVDEIPDPA